MMKKIVFVMLLLLLNSVAIAQKVCESADKTAEIDLNTISVTKCTIKEPKNKRSKKSRLISVTISANKRHLKKRKTLKKQEVASLGGINTVEVGEIVKNSEITGAVVLKNNIENLKNKLSKEEVRKALKFTAVDKIPVFKACEKTKKSETSDCFNTEMMRHISKHFSYPLEAIKRGVKGEVWVRFIIDKTGYVKNIKTLGPDGATILDNEAVRVVAMLPKFKPAKKDGNYTTVKYGFPINFALEE
ncbi:energy transducer TonB [Tenacibaculum dicentrarchi]|nr:energy transducer TonB [Tenacibaculum dicentrarchi]MCD8424307.1 energy transducer TonB [Tenacibaculum dicentrarchi]MCD8441612.1 energy transducer TonB [Tenacibaculum dicentrarchi]